VQICTDEVQICTDEVQICIISLQICSPPLHTAHLFAAVHKLFISPQRAGHLTAIERPQLGRTISP